MLIRSHRTSIVARCPSKRKLTLRIVRTSLHFRFNAFQTRTVGVPTARIVPLDRHSHRLIPRLAGIGQRSDLPPLSLSRGRTTLTLLLPTGSEPGPYEVQILDLNLTSRAAAVGAASLQDHVTTLRVSIDSASLLGQYQLAVRRSGDRWQMFPLLVR